MDIQFKHLIVTICLLFMLSMDVCVLHLIYTLVNGREMKSDHFRVAY